MSVLNIGQTQNILKNANAEKWTSQTAQVDFETGVAKDFNLGVEKSEGKTFGDFLKDSISEVNNIQNQANVAIQKLASGESKNIHETMIMVEQAELAFKTMNQIRTKVLEAYKEIMRMQI